MLRPSHLLPNLVVAVATLGCAASPAPAPGSSTFEGWVDSVAAETLRDGLVPGLSIAIARGPDIVLEKSYGRADIENDVPASNQTIYRIASVTKQFTAAAILGLVEQGRVDLDKDITTYIPEFHGHNTRISVRQLLNHTSGTQNLTDLAAFWSKSRLDLSDVEVLQLFQDEPRNFQPGGNFLYNNTGFYLLAMVIERVTGESYNQYLKRSIFTPLGLRSTAACDGTRIVPHRAHGYAVEKGQLQNEAFGSDVLPKGGGNLCSTAHDLVLWAHALAAGKVVSPQSYSLMTTPGRLRDGREIAYGFGLFLSTLEGRPEIFHGGDFGSFTAFLAWYPTENLTVAVLQNSGSAPAFDGYLGRRIARRVLQWPDPGAGPAGDRHTLDRYVGSYQMGTSSVTVRSEPSNTLILTGPNVWQLWDHSFIGQGDGSFVSDRNPEVRVRFDGAGAHSNTLSLTLGNRAFGDATYKGK